jgi:hypothetical protein
MKKLGLISFVMLISLASIGQVLTKTQISIPYGDTYGSYTAVAADTLTTNQDSILFPILVNSDKLYKITIGATFLGKTTADTIVKIAIWGKNFADEDYTYITSVNSAVVSSTTVKTQKTLAYGTAVQYRYLRIHFMRPPSGITVPTKLGSKLVKAEIKIWQQ